VAKRNTIVIGLTGSIGMGKSRAAQALRRLGVPVHDADAEVHRLLRQEGAVIEEVVQAFPGITRGGVVDRAALGRRVFGDSVALARLERIIHPRVQAAAVQFVRRARAGRVPVVVLDIPLLFETGAQAQCDAIVVVSAPIFVQEARVLHRRGMTRNRLAAILARQIPDRLKQRRAEFVVPTGLARRVSLQALGRIAKLMRRRRFRNRPKAWRVMHA
jgi:dephospho-CoA kinase